MSAEYPFVVVAFERGTPLAEFKTEEAAAQFIGELADHGDGIYSIDGPDDYEPSPEAADVDSLVNTEPIEEVATCDGCGSSEDHNVFECGDVQPPNGWESYVEHSLTYDLEGL